jgi:chemotaxis methyl-accepting protein methylase
MLTHAIANPDSNGEHVVQEILALVQARCGLDLRLYRRTTIRRRLHNRMVSLGMSRLTEYLDLALGSDDEVHRLVEHVTIKVSRFYRNPHTFEMLRGTVLPELAARRHSPLRVWSAGCGRGEEAYTVAMLLRHSEIEGTVLGTDVDGAALAHAARGLYSVDALTELPVELAERYFESVVLPRPTRRICAAAAETVRFARHDLTADAPPGEFDLVLCRNVLIYFERAAQAAAIGRLCAAMIAGGVLALGEAEWPNEGVQSSLHTIHARSRLFRLG